MSTFEITDKIRDILIEQLGTDPAEFNPGKVWYDYGADSLDIVEITMAVEDEFGLDIGDEDAERLGELPVSETIIWLESQLAQQS